MTRNTVTARVETWNVEAKNGKRKAIGKIVHRDGLGRFDGATNHRQISRVGQVRKSRR